MSGIIPSQLEEYFAVGVSLFHPNQFHKLPPKTWDD